MNILLYFGSFNPIHYGHLIIANHALNTGVADKLWFVVSPQNPLKKSSNLLNEYQRLYLLKLATEDDYRVVVRDIEFSLPKPSYTIDTLTYLSEKYPEYKFSILVGGDSIQNFDKWKNYEQILNNYSVYVYNRKEFSIPKSFVDKVKVLDAPLLEISSTMIRNLIEEKKSIRYLTPDAVMEEIEKGGYYKNGHP